MSEVSASLVRELRDRTGAGMMDCKKALSEVNGDVDKALSLSAREGLAAAAKRASRTAADGVVASYIHAGGKIGVLIEVNCEDRLRRAYRRLSEPRQGSWRCRSPRLTALRATRRGSGRRAGAGARHMPRRPRTAAKPPQVIEKMVAGKVEVLCRRLPARAERSSRIPTSRWASSSRTPWRSWARTWSCAASRASS